MRLLIGLLWAGTLVWAATFAIVLAVQALWPNGADPPGRADAIFCLGAGMGLDGWHRPGPNSARRARTCADLHAAGTAPVIVFTGYGHHVYSAAEAMADLARGQGVGEQAIIVETEAQSTIQNAAFGLALLPETPDRIVLVSDAFHLPRAWVIFRLLGVPEVALHAAERPASDQDAWRILLRWSFRESFAIWSNVGRLAVYGAAGLAGVPHETRIGWFD